ncbi:hypothetical protein SAMN05216553_102440 [Lentzea fradiae]|uniref:5-bromo-4-chloroindolyl phosphate hydrolysis protein n=1 Tax=Lentzea fradiae TaxID=200378 RepID=A0A1G7MPN5_9PSEU|nr:hypothetical protein [Lentzea fradiae]SDF63661.1 hypothetical protein SAMN05216553_102440 [Lentzea fradiae]
MGVAVRSTLWGAAIGTLLMGVFTTVIELAFSSDRPSPLYATIIATFVVAGVFGGVPGTFIGALVGFIRASAERARHPQPVHLRPPHPSHPRPRQQLPPPQPYDMWAELVERCAGSTRRVAAAVRTVPNSPAKEWLQRISEQLVRELDDVRGIAQLGRALGAVDRQHPVYQRLLKAVQDFRQFEGEVGRVALQMFDHPDLDEARTHLEMLERQLPQLSA